MTEIRFYHLQSKRLEQALPEIAAKALERGHRVVVRAGSKERIEALDVALWTYDAGSFLPHGYVHDGSEKQQPIWLTTGEDNPNEADVLILVDSITHGAMGMYKLCCEIFDGNDEDAVSSARSRWKEYKQQGFTLAYYQQNEQGKWEKKGE